MLAMLKWLMTLGVAVVVSLIAINSNSAELTVIVEGIRNARGEVRFALFDAPDQFPRGEKLDGKDVPAFRGSVTARFKIIKPGAYAVAIHHDENSDKEMNTNIIGWPQEGYGFSNDARVFILPPGFDAASFTIDIVDKIVRLSVVY